MLPDTSLVVFSECPVAFFEDLAHDARADSSELPRNPALQDGEVEGECKALG